MPMCTLLYFNNYLGVEGERRKIKETPKKVLHRSLRTDFSRYFLTETSWHFLSLYFASVFQKNNFTVLSQNGEFNVKTTNTTFLVQYLYFTNSLYNKHGLYNNCTNV